MSKVLLLDVYALIHFKPMSTCDLEQVFHFFLLTCPNFRQFGIHKTNW